MADSFRQSDKSGGPAYPNTDVPRGANRPPTGSAFADNQLGRNVDGPVQRHVDRAGAMMNLMHPLDSGAIAGGGLQMIGGVNPFYDQYLIFRFDLSPHLTAQFIV